MSDLSVDGKKTAKSLQVSGRDEAIGLALEVGLVEFEEKEILQPA